MVCSSCKNENPDGAKFCMSCGSALVNRCPECNTELPGAARFCLNCGHQLAPAGTADTAAEASRANLERYIPAELLNKLEAAKTGGKSEGERRIVTMLFCDVSGSTAAAEKLDPEEWAQIMNGAFENLIAPVYRYEGTLARLMGDAILAFFGAPIGHEDDPQRAVMAGLEIVRDIAPYREKVKAEWDLDIEVRVGINTGLVVVGEVGSDLRVEYTALGDAINLAARMEQAAQPGTVQVSSDTHRLVEPLFEFEDLGLIEVKGKSQPVRTYRAIAPKATPGSLRGIAGLRAPLIGRDKEINTLRQVAANLREGRGGIVSIIGEAGLGKSRLVQELRDELSAGPGLGDDIQWLGAQGVSYDTSRPYAFFSQQLRQSFGIEENDTVEETRQRVNQSLDGQSQDEKDNVADAVEFVLSNGSNSGVNVEGETAKRKMFEAVLRVWRQTTGPTVIFSEDLHWADPASVELLTHLFQLTEQAPILFLCAFRPDRQAPSWQVKNTGETDYPHLYTELALVPLSSEESDQLFGTLFDVPGSPPQLRQMVLDKTEGNPLFVEEFTRTLMDTGAIAQDENGLHWNPAIKLEETPIPENIQALLTSRIDRLEETARRTLQLSSVIGRSFYRRVLERISDPETVLDREISTLQRAELILEASRLPELEYSFRHDLTREAAYNSILLRARKDFHLRVGETVEELFVDRLEEQAHRLAYHFYESGADERALKYSLMAGEAAARLHAHPEANAHYARAMELLGRVESNNQQRIDTYIARGRTLELIGEYDEALANYQQLGDLGGSRECPAMELAALVAQATIHATSNPKFNAKLGRELSNSSLLLARELDDHQAESKVLWNLMLVEYYEGHHRESAVSYGEQSLAIARKHGLEEQLAYTLNDIAKGYFTLGKGEDAWAAQRESSDLLRKLGNLPMLIDSLITSAGGHYFLGDFADALASLEECDEVSKSIGSVRGQAVSLYVLGAVYMELGETGKATAALQEAIVLAKQIGFYPPVTARLRLALYCGMVGDIEGGLGLATNALEEGDNRQFSLAAQAQAHLCAGDNTKAQELIIEACKGFETGESDPKAGYSVFQVIEGDIALANQRYDDALALAERTLATLDEMGQRVTLPDILRCKAEALIGLGRLDEAQAVLDQALTEADTQGSQRALCHLLPALAKLSDLRGLPDKASEFRLRARETVAYISDRTGSDEMRAMFLNSAKIKELMSAP